MARRVSWAETAWRDLEQTADHIAEDSPGYAASFVRRIRDRARTLEELPHRGRVVPELGDRAVRELLIGNYRLIYEIHEVTVFVLGMIHGARDLATLWEADSRDLDRQSRADRTESGDDGDSVDGTDA